MLAKASVTPRIAKKGQMRLAFAGELDTSLVRRSLAIHFGVGLTGPFVEGSCVVRCPVVTQDLQDKRRETRARTAPSVGSDRGLRCDPFSRQEGG